MNLLPLNRPQITLHKISEALPDDNRPVLIRCEMTHPNTGEFCQWFEISARPHGTDSLGLGFNVPHATHWCDLP